MSDSIEPVVVLCPRCNVEHEDFDGFGILACDNCGYCTHPNRYDRVCDICGDIEPEVGA